MSELIPLLAALAAGVGLGLLYFYGLWLTVRRLSERAGQRQVPLWLLLSWVLRLGILLAGLYGVGSGDWRRLVAALAGILLARLVLTRRISATLASVRAMAGQEGAP